MTPRERVRRTIRFQSPDRLAVDLPDPYESDFVRVGMHPSPDARYSNGVDEWGSVWRNVGVSNFGEVARPVLQEWNDWDRLKIPDIRDEARWQSLDGARERAGDKFLLAWGISIYERLHFLRGLENTWVDIYDEPGRLGELIDILVDMNLYAIERYAAAGADGFIWCDDWGLQDRLMISPEAWRQLWKPRYARIFQAVHDAGLLVFLHSCGNITSILDDFIEIGLDVIQMDQQENMGLEFLGQRFGGRIAFWSPVDIQHTMVKGTTGEIRDYCRTMVACLGGENGGFFAKWYEDPKGAGHSNEALEAMCDEFTRIRLQGFRS